MVRPKNNMVDNLKDIAREIRKDILTASYEAQACHIGSALSCVDILVGLYFKRMKDGDKFIFSKASGAAALYCVLSKMGHFEKERIPYYLKNYPLPTKDVPGVEISCGSLGHGLPIAVGMALADRKKDIYILMSDGEIQEGTTWESILFARHHKLNNLKIIIDRNGFQACGKTEDILGINEPLKMLQKLFPIEVVETIKGGGVDFMENNNCWHYNNLTLEQLNEAICKI